jgi:hypothetical protein
MPMLKSKISTCHLTYIQKITLTQCSKRFYTIKYPPPPSYYDTKKPRSFRFGILFFIIGATISYNYPLYNLGEKIITLPDEKDEKACNKYTADLENQLQKLSIVNKYRNDPNYVEYRGWNHLDTTPSGLSSFHGTLLTPGGIAVPPISFHCQENGDDLVIVHVGRRLSGYPFIVHGGVLGTIIDEVFKTNLIKEFPNLSFDTVHTKSLELNYSFPTFVNQFIVINSSLMKTDNNDDTTYSVQSDVSTLDGSLLIKANAILSSDISPSSKSASTPTILQQGPGTCKKGWFW